MRRDLYEVLGISRNATDKEIKTAYRKLAKRYHPDANKDDEKVQQEAQKRFAEINEAYEILSNKDKRKLYDLGGFDALEGNMGTSGTGSQGPFGGGFANEFHGFDNGFGKGSAGGFRNGYRSMHFDGSSFEDIFGDLFGQHIHGQNKNSGQWYSGADSSFGAMNPDGDDITSDFTISFDEAVYGCKKTVRLQNPDAGGQNRTLEITIPAGIDEGKCVRLKGKGTPARAAGGQAGDLLLRIHITPKKGYERKGLDIYMDTRIPFITAVLGGEQTIRTPQGEVVCKIPAGTQSGSKIRLKGRGISKPGNKSCCGDAFAVINIDVPKNISEEARRCLESFDREIRGGSGKKTSAA